MGLDRDGGPSVAARAPRRRFPRAGAFAALVLVAAATVHVSASPGDLVSRFQARDAVTLGAASNVRLSATAPVTRALRLARTSVPTGSSRLVLELGEITFSAPPPVAYDVYVGLPPGAAPRTHDAHHVGSLTFYGLDGKRAPRGTRTVGQLLDVTSTARAGARHGTIAITFVPFALVDTQGATPPNPPTGITIGRIELRIVPAP